MYQRSHHPLLWHLVFLQDPPRFQPQVLLISLLLHRVFHQRPREALVQARPYLHIPLLKDLILHQYPLHRVTALLILRQKVLQLPQQRTPLNPLQINLLYQKHHQCIHLRAQASAALPLVHLHPNQVSHQRLPKAPALIPLFHQCPVVFQVLNLQCHQNRQSRVVSLQVFLQCLVAFQVNNLQYHSNLQRVLQHRPRRTPPNRLQINLLFHQRHR